MVDSSLFPNPPTRGILVPAPADEILPIVRRFWHEHFTGDPALIDSFWSVVPGTKNYSATLNYLPGSIPTYQELLPASLRIPANVPELDWYEQTKLRDEIGVRYPGQRIYTLHFIINATDRIEAHVFRDYRDWDYYSLYDLSELDPSIPDDPWDFAESRGVTVQRWPERPSPPVHVACVIEDATPEELRSLCEGQNVTLTPVTLGTLVAGYRSSSIGIDAAYELNKIVYVLKVFPTVNEFMCTVFQDGGNKKGCFVSPPAETRHPRLDSVLGETTPRGILRALEVPPELVGLEPDESPPTA